MNSGSDFTAPQKKYACQDCNTALAGWGEKPQQPPIKVVLDV